MSRLKIHHTTRYDYEGRVGLSYNEARMSPLTDAQQVVLESTVQVLPGAGAVQQYRDYWGTRVTAFDVGTPHDYLQVDAEATVEVHRSERPAGAEHLAGWEVLGDEAAMGEFSDWLPQSALSEPGPDVVAAVAHLAGAATPHEAALGVLAWLQENVEYVPGVTGVHFKAEDVWAERRGVCQDLAHLGIGALRSLGIPARYVSGYIHPRPQAAIGETVAGQSHAWVEWWDGEWRSWDSTNHKPASDLHVSVARGRDYRDVSPLKGIQAGGRGVTLDVSVKVTRLA
ncbi:transglutaminase family protein [Zafaria sp. Z1313]|uniref:transglutaminase family protein n=1 Tax=unclassified Zafaria TaxID=2828765 RepID=UPI002E764859|nr:transglutaminase family protein [Zafaria sp. J156]MEE1620234.1 transglutaminase family protein [Zafaria sp. J156]